MKRTFIRVVCAALCAAMFLGTFTVAISAEEAEAPETTEAVETVETAEAAPAGEGIAVLQAEGEPSTLTKIVGGFFRIFGFLGFRYEPTQGYFYNIQPSFQWLGGFNAIYDTIPFLLNVYADVLKFNFTYEEKDWLIQCWKGGYAVCLSTGGEIGVYTKPVGSALNHFTGAVEADWLKMEMSIYNKNAKLFTRPGAKYWWCTGYALSMCTDFLSKPRRNVVMAATIEFKDGGMRAKFVEQLDAKHFTPLGTGEELGLSVTDKYELNADGKTVRFFWKSLTDGWY